MKRVLCWFSCGAASAVAAKLTVDRYKNAPTTRVEVVYCDTLAFEHPDNVRFLADVETWLGVPVKFLRSATYTDIFDVFRKTGWLVGPKGARCTAELKRNVRKAYEAPGDLHVFGFTAEERHRIDRFEIQNPSTFCEWPLYDAGLTKRGCYEMIGEAGIKLPEMYSLGYRNNNCIGCVKGQSGYWNKIRKDFPEAFDRMAKMERELNAAINKRYVNGKRIRVFLDELPRNAGRYEMEEEVECGVLCAPPQMEMFS
jgi:3'-phosphoadenosine 5'-phosphosulfate sulfotransferase (PAPS reductase)/FAD synthetase